MIHILRPEKGKFLVSEPFMLDPNFKRAVVLLTEHNSEGSVGFVLNQALNLYLNDVMPDDFPKFEAKLYAGGPVGTDTLHYLHRLGDLLPDSLEIAPGIYWGGDFDQLQELLKENKIRPEDIRFFLGYSGWDAGQLDTELKDNSWLIAMATVESAFSEDAEELWKNVVKGMGQRYQHIANFPENPSWN